MCNISNTPHFLPNVYNQSISESLCSHGIVSASSLASILRLCCFYIHLNAASTSLTSYSTQSFTKLLIFTLTLLWWFPPFALLPYFHHIISFTACLTPSHAHSFAYPIHSFQCIYIPVYILYIIHPCIFLPIVSFYALKELTVKGHKISIVTHIKYLHYHSSYYLMCPSVTSVTADFCINTCLKLSSHLSLSSLPTYSTSTHLYFVYNLN